MTFREENCVAAMFVHQTGELGLKVDINDERNGHEPLNAASITELE